MTLKLNLRTRVEMFKGSDMWEEVIIQKEVGQMPVALRKKWGLRLI